MAFPSCINFAQWREFSPHTLPLLLRWGIEPRALYVLNKPSTTAIVQSHSLFLYFCWSLAVHPSTRPSVLLSKHLPRSCFMQAVFRTKTAWVGGAASLFLLSFCWVETDFSVKQQLSNGRLLLNPELRNRTQGTCL